jgi:hypothetical protein
MQVIFDNEKTVLYKYLRTHLKTLQKHVDRLDEWFSNFEKNEGSKELDEAILIVSNIAKSMYRGIGIDGEVITYTTDVVEDDK